MTRPLLVVACLIAALATLAGLWALTQHNPIDPFDYQESLHDL